jgi:O-antigen/teichoic acid export membrane protein
VGERKIEIQTRFSRNFAIQVIGQVSSRLLGFYFFIYIARIMGVESFGIFSTAISIGLVVMTFMDFGLDAICTRTIARRKYDMFPPIVQLKIIMIGIGFIVSCSSFYLFKRLGYALPLLSVGFCVFSALNFIYGYFRGKERMHIEVFLLFLQRALLVASGMVLISSYPTVISASLCFAFSYIVVFFVALYFVRKSLKLKIQKYFQFHSAAIKKAFITTFPLAVASILGVLYYRIDALLLAMYSGMSDVGLYQGAFKLIEAIALVGSILTIVTFPQLSRYGGELSLRFKDLYNSIYKIYFFAGIIVTICVFYFSDDIVAILFGESFQGSSSLLRLLILSVPASYPGHLVTQALIAMDCQVYYMYIIGAATVINICLNLIVIPKYGAIGAAWTMVCTTYLITISCTIFIGLRLKNR